MSPTSRHLTVAVATFAVLLSACGSAGGEQASSSKDDNAGTADTEQDGTGSPLESLFGFDENSQRLVEDAVASCMRDRGWEYTPRPPADFTALDAQFGGDDFVADYGYGISTDPPMEGFVASTGVGVDANDAYIKTLSEADQQRYYGDLYGGVSTDGAVGSVSAVGAGGAMGELDPNACTMVAQETAAKENPALGAEFAKRLGELMGRLEDDPRAIDAESKWSGCMADAGFVYQHQNDVFTDLMQRNSEIRGTEQAAAGAGGGATVVVGGQPGSTVPLSPADAERLKKLQDEERAIAKADNACAAQHLAGVREELELEVYETLQSEFPGLGEGS